MEDKFEFKALLDGIADNLDKIKATNPLVHNITNIVVANITANALIAIGASPIMAHAKEEVAQMVGISKALVLNIGTLSESIVESMLIAGKEANRLNIPVILDPVGAGATEYRNSVVKKIAREIKLSAVRGNASEIANMSGVQMQTKGVDSTGEVKNIIDISKSLANNLNCTVCASGAEDIATDGKETYLIKNGDIMLTKITGSGCISTALMGAFLCVDDNPLRAVVSGAVFMGICGELAAKISTLQGIFQVALFNELSDFGKDKLSLARFSKYQKI